MNDVYVWEAMALKAAETAMEKAMLEVLREKQLPAETKLAVIKRSLVHQHSLTLAYVRAMENAK